MSNISEEALTDPKKLEERLLGPPYNYYQFIKDPKKVGMRSKGSIKAISNNIKGLIAYVQVLVTGGGKAQKGGGKALGNKFFLDTGATCKDKATGDTVSRSVYIDNVPDGSIPFITSMSGIKMTSMKGLVPGTMSNVSRINPVEIFQAFTMGTNPDCRAITLPVIDSKGKKSNETQYLALTDIKNMKESFQGLDNNLENIIDYSRMPDDKLIQLYYSALGILGLYILFRLFERNNTK